MTRGGGSETFDALLAAIARTEALPPVLPRRLGNFSLGSKLGEGGFGAVYEATDERDQRTVALKVLRTSEAEWLLRFKREFRLLADVVHPNLVRLEELAADDGTWFFTMELVRGVPFVDYLTRVPTALTDAFGQLVNGLGAIHDAGRIHRDLKPSNVLVDANGKVKILDFGLAIDTNARESTQIAGTLQYMAPEQFGFDELGPPCDLYAIGVMLFEVLTLSDPFSGSAPQVALAKREPPGEAFRNALRDAPPALAAVTLALLDPRPEVRPTRQQVLDVLGGEGKSSRESPAPEVFVGRSAQLATLDRALDDLDRGRPVVTLVAGASGMGKSALLDQFVNRMRTRMPSAVVLRTRCYAEESIPYKALDGIIDQLARHLSRLNRAQVAAILPRNASALLRLFPTLAGVDAIQRARRLEGGDDGHEARRRAWGALRDLFGRLADQSRLVLVIDDVQWGDADSIALIGEILRPPDAAPLLVVAAFRSDERASSPFLRGLDELARTGLVDVPTTLEVGALDDRETAALVHQLASSHRGTGSVVADVLAASGGCPFLVHELTRQSSTEGLLGSPERAVERRLDRLAPEVKWVLDRVALAARPLPLPLLQREHEGAEIRPILSILGRERLIRIREVEGRPVVETYHDKIREAVTRMTVLAERRTAHDWLARALEKDGAEPEVLAVHLEGAGQHARAAEHLLRAARSASDALAFDHASGLLRRAIDLRGRSREFHQQERAALLCELGDTLAVAGKGSEAADAYLASARGGDDDETFELRRRAGEQLFLAGSMDRGREVLGALFDRVGLELPTFGVRTMARIVTHRARLRLRGYEFVERPESSLTTAQRRELDLLTAAAVGLFTDDPPAANLVVCDLTRCALDSGVLPRIVEALALDTTITALVGDDWRPAQRALSALARRMKSPAAEWSCLIAEATALSFQGRWRAAMNVIECAQTLTKDSPELARVVARSPLWSRSRYLRFDALFWTGAVGEAASALPSVLQDLKERGNIFGFVWMSFIWSWVMCAQDRPDEAREILENARRVGGKGGMIPRVWWSNNALAIALYRGDSARARACLDESPLRAIHQPFIGRGGRAQYRWNHARAALLAAREHPHRRRELLQQAKAHARAMVGQETSSSEACALGVRAAIAHLEGDDAHAIAILAEAESVVRECDMSAVLAAARRLRGRLTGGAEGATWVRSAEAWAEENGVVSLERFSRIYLPGALV